MNTPSHEHRLLIERLGQAFREGVEEAMGRPVDMGLPGAWDDHETQARPAPIRVIVVRFGRPLRDVALFVSSLKEDVVRPLAEAGAARVLEELEITPGADAHGPIGEITIEPVVEYETNAEAMEQCDGFYLEPTIHYALPTGDLCVVMGTGLLQSSEYHIKGESDPLADPLPGQSRQRLELADGIGADDDGSRYEFGGGAIGDGDVDQTLVTGAIGDLAHEDRVVFADGDIGAGGHSTAAGDAGSAAGTNMAGLADSILAGFDDDDAAAAADGDSPGEIVYTDQGPMSVAEYEAMLAADAANEARSTAAAAGAAAAANADAARASAAAAEAQPERLWASLLSGVEVELSAELGRTNLALGDLASLVFDSVLTLDQLVDEPVNVLVNGTEYATARLVVVEGEFGIEIIDVVGAAQLVEQLAA